MATPSSAPSLRAATRCPGSAAARLPFAIWKRSAHAAGRYPPPYADTPTPRSNNAASTAKPLSPLIIGNNFGVANLNQGRPCPCGISLAFPGRPHRAFECPIRYWLVHGACPGWNADGTRVPSSWNGDDITTACQAQWRNFVTTLRPARTAGAPDVQF